MTENPVPGNPDYSNMNWEETKFGKKTAGGYLQLYPGRNTSMGADPSSLDEFGLRGHPNQVWEHVEHLGFLLGPLDANDYSLIYRSRAKYGKTTQEQCFAPGAKFYSVQMDFARSGFWHILENTSFDRTIVLKITKENKKK